MKAAVDHLTSHLRHVVSHAAHLLPAQGPIGVFIHHNTLHAFQHLPFEEAVASAAAVYGTEPYMSEDAYRREVGRGRIQIEDIDAVLATEAGADAEVWGSLTRRELRRRLLIPGLRQFQPETIRWELEEGGLLQAIALDHGDAKALFTLCLENTPVEIFLMKAAPARPRDGFVNAGCGDIDSIIHPWLIRFSAAYLDQGIAYWPMPNRELGFLRAVQTLIEQPQCLWPDALRTLPQRARAWGDTAETVIFGVLEEFGVLEAEWESLVQAELLALPGWAGMMSRLELEPDLAPHEFLPVQLIDFLGVRLLLTISASDSFGRPTRDWRVAAPADPKPEPAALTLARLARAATLFDAAIQLGMSDGDLRRGGVLAIDVLRREIFAFTEIERRRVLHLAYERRHERQVLLPIQEHRARPPLPQPDRLSAQIFFCLDDREESMRRHLEEIAPEVETFGAAGFFGVAVNYRGLDDAQGVSLCPVVVKPRHAVVERPVGGHHNAHATRTRLRKLWAKVMQHWTVASRTMIRGFLGTGILGLFSLFPMAMRVLSPRRYSKLTQWLNASVLPEPRTELVLERDNAAGEAVVEGMLHGFTITEQAAMVGGLLRAAGLTKGMARLVALLGHGSTSINNPFESAYNCGACGGRRGGPNARMFGLMANRPEVRAILAESGIHIPTDTVFLGGYHDTTTDEVLFLDHHLVPASHVADLAHLEHQLDLARRRNAHERARRFEAAIGVRTTRQALKHVEERAEHLAEPRPECGHATNAVCIIGRRSSTRGLFLDRRAFLISYDAAQDPTDASLEALLGAAFPVCGGINLEYYFSYVDNEGYGCGSKLPHNVSGLLGVMNGYEGDLRTGLPWQMVEIHEPVRLLFIIESTPERIVSTIQRSALLWEVLEKRWIRLAAMDPQTGAMLAYRHGFWEPVAGDDEPLATAPVSAAWYAGHIDHLPIARIEGPAVTVGVPV